LSISEKICYTFYDATGDDVRLTITSLTRRHSIQRILPPRHIKIGTVSLPASSR